VHEGAVPFESERFEEELVGDRGPFGIRKPAAHEGDLTLPPFAGRGDHPALTVFSAVALERGQRRGKIVRKEAPQPGFLEEALDIAPQIGQPLQSLGRIGAVLPCRGRIGKEHHVQADPCKSRISFVPVADPIPLGEVQLHIAVPALALHLQNRVPEIRTPAVVPLARVEHLEASARTGDKGALPCSHQ